MKTPKLNLAPEWQVSEWLNSSEALALNDLRGRVVFVEAFQMLCPGCVSHALPQAKRVAETFDDQDVVVIGTAVVQFQPRFGKRLERDRVSLARTLAVGCPSSRQRNTSQR